MPQDEKPLSTPDADAETALAEVEEAGAQERYRDATSRAAKQP